jgi:hypothetical protein
MKKLIAFPFLFFPMFSAAQVNQDLAIRGELLSDQRLFLENSIGWGWNENRLDLSLGKRMNNVRFYGNIWARHLGTPQINTTYDLYNKDRISPWNLDIREAYAEVRGFLFKDLDLKIGRQRIAWGTADRFNPTDNLNPYDLEDLPDFGRHNGSEALTLNWYFSNTYSLQAVMIPIFRPANLPLGIFSGVFNSELKLQSGFVINEYSDQVVLPRQNLAEGTTAGFRLKGFALKTDFSLSYVYGRDGLPMVRRVELTSGTSGTDLYAEMFFPRYHIFGADLAGSLGSAGIWSEAALFIPRNDIVLTTEYIVADDIIATTDSVVMKKEPFVKFVIGSDYTFRNGLYLNLQYLRGFIHERGKGNMNDYLMIAMERNIWRDHLLVKPLAGGAVISDWEDPANNYALIYSPEITYNGIDNFEISLGCFIFDGKGENLFAGLRRMNMLILRAKLSF